MKLQIAVCDDERILCGDIRKQILKTNKDYTVDTFLSGEELIEKANKYDVIFMDIEMPDENGMEIAQKLRNLDFEGYIIFLTSHVEFMQEAFKVKTFRYLNKPINNTDIEEALSEIEKELASNRKIIVDEYGKETIIDIKNIIYIKSENRTTNLYLVNGIIETKYPLKYWMGKLNDCDFCRSHKSYYVSMRHISVIETDRIILKDKEKSVPISRRNYNNIKQSYFNYIRKTARLL